MCGGSNPPEGANRELLDSSHTGDVFEERDRLICRVDQIARREGLVERIRQTDWDLVVVDEAHRMSARFFGTEVKKTKKYQLGETLGSIARHFLLMTATPHAVLALVEVAPDGTDTVRHLRRPFEGRGEDFVFDLTSVNFIWSALWDRATNPS